MRHLSFARPLSPAQQAEAAEALEWLECQPVPDGCPTDMRSEFRYLVAVARQYEKQGLSLRELVEAGYRAGLAALANEPDSWSWWVREGLVGVLENSSNR